MECMKGLKVTLILINAVILAFYLVNLAILGWEFWGSPSSGGFMVETAISLISKILEKTLFSSLGIVLHGASLLVFTAKSYKKNQL